MCVCSRPRMIHDNDPTDLHIPQIYGLLKWIYFSASSYPSACSTHMGKSLRWCQIMMVWRIVKIEKGLKAKFRVTSDFISRSNFQTNTFKWIIWIRVTPVEMIRVDLHSFYNAHVPPLIYYVNAGGGIIEMVSHDSVENHESRKGFLRISLSEFNLRNAAKEPNLSLLFWQHKL